MSQIERYRLWYEHEKATNKAMLNMLATVPESARQDPRFDRALTLAAHLAACREIWLDFMVGGGKEDVVWWPKDVKLEDLPGRFAAIEAKWTEYLSGLDDDKLDADFDFFETDGSSYRWSIEGQIFQLVGHAPYHRGQIALLVDQLGGETVDTDYVDWRWGQLPDRWKRLS